MALASSTKLGPYEILCQIGAGGMGEVYRARDTRLHRTVAIKVLPAELSQNLQLKQRFEREARVISTLSHPHICTLHDVGSLGDTSFLVMEYLEGRTLAERIAKGRLPLEEALKYAVQICEALDVAHQSGIIHRDLKPGNIIITRTGVKLLDFGLAKFGPSRNLFVGSNVSAESAMGRGEGIQPTLKEELTKEGTLLGTLAYMAPEQLEGKEADARTDLFALGLILYEMLTGTKAFTGKSQASLMAAILKETPLPLQNFQPTTPKALDWVLQKCLAKDPEQRWQSVRDLKFQLECVTQIEQSSALKEKRRASPKIAIASLALAAAAIIMAVASFLHAAPQEEPKSLTLRIPNMKFAINSVIAVSPNGSHLIYCASRASEPLYLRPMGSSAVEPIPGTEGAEYVFFSPDGLQVGYFQRKKLFKMALVNRLPQAIADVPETPIRGADWGEDGFIYFATRFDSVIKKVPSSGGPPEPVTKLREREAGHNHPLVLAGGKGLIFTVIIEHVEHLGVLPAGASEHQILQRNGSRPQLTESEHLMYYEGSKIMAVRLDLKNLVLRGSPSPVFSGVTFANQPFAVSRNGLLVFFSEEGNKHELCWVTSDGSALNIHEFQRTAWEPAICPTDPSKVLIRHPQVQCQLWLFDFDRRQHYPFAVEGDNHTGTWSPDGQQVAFCRMQLEAQLILKSIGGEQVDRIIWTNKFLEAATSFSPDGRLLTVNLNHPVNDFDIWLVDVTGATEARPWKNSPHRERDAQFSPTGEWIAYVSNETGMDEVYLHRAEGQDNPRFVSVGGGTEPLWHPKGNKLFFRKGGKVYQVDIRSETTSRMGLPQLLFEGDFEENVIPTLRLSYDFDPVNERFLMIRRTGGRSEELQVHINWLKNLPE